MYLPKDHHVSRHAPYKKLLRDNDDNTIGFLPHAFEMREKLNEEALSVNWLEYFGNDFTENIVKMIQSFRRYRASKGSKVGINSAFGIGNVETLEETCTKHGHTKVRVVHEEKKVSTDNESHSRIIHLPINDEMIMKSLASDVFIKIVPNKDIPD